MKIVKTFQLKTVIFTAVKNHCILHGPVFVMYQKKVFVCLFGLRLYVPVNNFSVMSGRSHRFLGITSTFLGGKCILLKDTTRDLSED